MPTRISGTLERQDTHGLAGILSGAPSSRAVPRRVLMTADGVGGVWPCTLDLASGLAARGVEVTVAVMGPPLLDHQLAEAARRGLALIEGGYALEWMDNPWNDVDAAGEWLLGLERTTAPDLVHLNGFCHAALPWRAPTVVAGHSCVRSWWLAVHGVEAPPQWARYTERVAEGLRAATLVVAPSAAMLSALEAEYGPLGPARVIPNGLAHVRRSDTTAAKQDLVFSAGRIWDDAKNIEALCAVASSLPWPVAVAGDRQGPHGPCAPTAGVNSLGQLPREGVQAWYDRAGIYVLPARYEPFGLSVLEAAAAGCALVLGDIRSLRENWHGAAVFVPPDNRRALAAAIRELSADPERRHTLAQAAAGRASTFTLNRMVAGYLDAYRSLTPVAVHQ
ncbi:glycosyltransferase family 4 protein [soil metagenome]